MKLSTFLISIVVLHAVTACSGGWLSNFVQKKLQKAARLFDGGTVFKFWKDADVPIYMLVRFFNVTNPDRVIRGDKPILEELGPYVYQENRDNIVEEFNPDNSTVSYRMKIRYTFRPDYSQGLENDTITTLNLPYIVMQEKSANLSSFEKYLVREVFTNHNERLFIVKNVNEILFEGYHQPSVAEMAELSGETLLANNTFGFFYGKNNTPSDLLEIYTGVGTEQSLGQTRSWEGQTELSHWDDRYCNMINGSDGSVFPPWLTRNVTLRIFSPDMCRSIYLLYEKDVRVTAIPAYKFVVPRELMASPEENPDNHCYCKGEEFGPCLKTGVMRLAPCRSGAPVVISWPHFYNGDEEYVNQSIGLSPEASLHETFLVLEPYTGLIRRGSKRYQINVELKPNKQFKDMKRVPNMLFPMLWVEESKLSRFRTHRYFSNNKNDNEANSGVQLPSVPFSFPPFPPPVPLPLNIVQNVLAHR